jgi:sec-independent protein translocase protein TatB
MFDIGFSEIVVIMVVALIVIGPERLPKVARTLGLLWGRAQRYVNGVRADIERDMNLEEIRQIKQKMEQDVLAAEQAARDSVHSLEHEGRSIAKSIETTTDAENLPISDKPEEFRRANLKEGQEVIVAKPVVDQAAPTNPAQAAESKSRSVPVKTPVSKPKENAIPVQQQFPID